jgi:hypothetical protein
MDELSLNVAVSIFTVLISQKKKESWRSQAIRRMSNLGTKE